MVIASAIALELSPGSVGIGIVLPALLFYFIYVEDRRRIQPEDVLNRPYRTQLVSRYQRPLLVTETVAIVSYEALLLYLVHAHPASGLGWIALGQLPLGALAIYSRVKRFPTFDSVIVGATWAFAIVFTVLVSTGKPLTADSVAVFVAWWLCGFAGAESRNVADISGDVATAKPTLAAALGKRRTAIVEWGLKAVTVGIFWAISGFVPAALVVAYLAFLRTFRSLTRRVERTMDSTAPAPA